MDSFITECQEKVGNHVNLIKFIRESCKEREIEFVKFALSTEKLSENEKIKFLILSTCFDSIEGRKIILETASLSSFLFEMLLSEKIQKISKEEFLNIFKKNENEEFKLKMIKKLFNHPKYAEIADELLSGHSVVLSNLQFYEALKFASTDAFVKNLPRCEKSSIPWKEYALNCYEKLLKYYDSEFSKLKWHEYSSKWNYICSNLPNNSEVLKSEFLYGLLELYEKYPPYNCNHEKELSATTPNYSNNLKLKVLNGLFKYY